MVRPHAHGMCLCFCLLPSGVVLWGRTATCVAAQQCLGEEGAEAVSSARVALVEQPRCAVPLIK